MPKPTPVEDLVIPPQDGKICGTICICQLTAVLSTVAIVYLAVAIYMPSSRAFSSGIVDVPVMCQTARALNKDNCEWGSCGEWCLSKTSGACIQIYVDLRRNGSDLHFAECTNVANKTCLGIDQEHARKYHCIRDDCKNLTGTFNCTAGVCINITHHFQCDYRDTDPPLKCSGRRGKITCIDIDGLFDCSKGTCQRIRSPYNCDRRCVDIPTVNKNVIILSGDRVFLARCARAVIGHEKGETVWTDGDSALMASCYGIGSSTLDFMAFDCVDGALLERSMLVDFANFTYLSRLHTVVAKPERTIAPPTNDLIIANDSKLMINLEGCVNTLRDECRDFLKEYGRDGTDHNARARFPCFYAEGAPEIVVAHFDLTTTYRQFLIASVIPSVLFVVSCVTLVLCQRTIQVGDDAKMRFKGCVTAVPPDVTEDPVSPL